MVNYDSNFSGYMDDNVLTNLLVNNLGLTSILALFIGYFLNHLVSRKVFDIAKRNNLFVKVNHRSSHTAPVPAFGGISIFTVFICVSVFILGNGGSSILGFIILSSVFLFVVGLKDDLIGVSPRTKLLVQLFSGGLILLNSGISVTNLNGFFGMGNIPPMIGFFISLSFIVFLINAYNLIDGIDGLAGIVAIISFSSFNLYYFLNDHLFLSFITSMITGSFVNFLYWNLSNEKRKMFLGDTGSLVTGFLLSINALIIISDNPIIHNAKWWSPENKVIFILSILVIPILDTFRVIVIRLYNGQKPWIADRRHMHHLLLDKGLTHKQATLALSVLQLIAVLGYFAINKSNSLSHHLFLISLYSTYACIFYALNFKKKYLIEVKKYIN